ncbi:MAG: hypothetical protein M3Y33_10390, partial [Actinomycetota bacterium]|nr:hypothetical protein [Actinomycetota bacterium]
VAYHVTLGFGAALTHLLRRGPDAGPDSADVPEAAAPAPAGLNGHAHRAAEMFAADLAAGKVPASGVSALGCTSAGTRPGRYSGTCAS